MPRFAFPVPGRRQRNAGPPATSGPLNKVQKILGTGQINTESTAANAGQRDPSRLWETASNSGMSISISESSASHDDRDAEGLGTLTEGMVVNSMRPRIAAFDEESNIIPYNLRRISRSAHGEDTILDNYTNDVQSMTDASSLRRRKSSSTITSYYDKSKVPLGISQQTSSSAIAKGLPSKADALLDIGGTLAPPVLMSKKKKPSRLDLSHLLPNRKPSVPSLANAQRGVVLGPDLMVRSPSLMSVSPFDLQPSPMNEQNERELRRKPTRESLREVLGRGRGQGQGHGERFLSPPQTASGPRRAAQEDPARLHNLYEHYEQMSLRDLPEEGVDSRASAVESRSSQYTSVPPAAAVNRGQVASISNAATRGTLSGKRSMGNMSAIETPVTAIMDTPTLHSPTADCSASVSSRHTRTSKNTSLVDIDLQQNSILSLSSDSEDDFVDSRPKTSVSVPTSGPRSPSEAPSSPSATRPFTSRSLPGPGQGKTKAKLSVSVNPSNASGQYLTIPDAKNATTTTSVKPPTTVNTRTSSLSISTNSTAKASQPASRSSSTRTSNRTSIQSSSTANTVSTPGTSHFSSGPSVYGTNEARTITMVPAPASTYPSSSTSSSAGTHGAHRASLEHPTPPLSPTSVDFYLRSHHNSMMDFDQGSVRSGNSLATVGSARNSVSGAQGRMMAVTRQEELLLAALRMKRARMRENIIAEFEEEQEKTGGSPTASQPETSAPVQRPHFVDTEGGMPVHASTVTELHAPRPRRGHNSSVSFRDFPMHIIEDVSPAGTPAQSLSVTPALSPLPSASSPALSDPSRTGSAAATAGEQKTKHERVLLYLDRPQGSVTPLDTAEPSPDLSDFMDFDDDDDARSGTASSTGSFAFPAPPEDRHSIPLQAQANVNTNANANANANAPETYLRPNAYQPPPPASSSSAGSSSRSTGTSSRPMFRLTPQPVPQPKPKPNSARRRTADGQGQGQGHGHGQPYRDHHVRIVGDADPVEIPAACARLAELAQESSAGGLGIPRPDSPVDGASALLSLPRKKAVRISAVGAAPMGPGWWGHDG